jgi:predicted HD phosphohydrolase
VSGETNDIGVDDIVDVLVSGAGHALSPGVGVSQLEHALQTAALLERQYPGDAELALAGLVHDIGHLLPGGTDETHAEDAAVAVRRALGERVAGIVALHVEAKRYLVATESGYDGALSGDSVVSLGRQGGALTPADVTAFAARPHAGDAVVLRRADDRAKVPGLEVPGVDHWVPRMQQLTQR